jgi:hypothetical protein
MDPPSNITYSSVAERDSIQLAFLIVALNDLELLCGDIGNAYLKAETKDKVHTICGPEFGHALQGWFEVIHCALYGLKSSGAAWWSTFAGTLQDM